MIYLSLTHTNLYTIDNHGVADLYDEENFEGSMCKGEPRGHFDKKFTPNGFYHCHQETPSSRKCANNHMY